MKRFFAALAISLASISAALADGASFPIPLATANGGLGANNGAATGVPIFASGVSTVGTVPVSAGGTGQTSFTANAPIIGNGTGGLAQGTRSGNTTAFATVSGSLTNGYCLQADSSQNVVAASAACGVGTVNSGTSGYLAYYASTGNAVSGLSNIQVNTATNTVLVVASGSSSLVVQGNVPILRWNNPSGGTDQKLFDMYASTSGTFLMRALNDANTSSSTYMQVTENTGTYTVKNVAFPSGNLLVGTTTDNGTLLQVIGGIYAASSLTIDAASYGRVIFEQSATSIWSIGPRADANFHIYRESGAGNIILEEGSGGGGGVAIGNTSPRTNLDVNGVAAVNNILAQPSGTNGAVSLIGGDGSNSGYVGWYLPASTLGGGTRIGYMGYDGDTNLKLTLDANTTFYIYASQVYEQNSSGNAVFSLNDNATGHQAVLSMQSAGTTKWQIGKQTDNSFFLYDSVHSANPFTVDTGGNVAIGESGKGIYLTGVASGTSVNHLCLDAGNKIITC